MTKIRDHVMEAYEADLLETDELDSWIQSLVDTGEIWEKDINLVYLAAALIKAGRVIAPVSHEQGGEEDDVS